MTLAEKKDARLEEWRGWITGFLDYANGPGASTTYTTIPNAAELLNDYYWKLSAGYLKQLLAPTTDKEPNIHFYKIISASELTVMAVVPITVAGETSEQRREINAEFAWFVGVAIMLNWKIKGKEVIQYEPLELAFSEHELIDYNDSGEEKLYHLDFREEHIQWLSDLNPAAPLPVLSNSQTWRLLFLAAKARQS